MERNVIHVYNINYDFIPTVSYGKKMMWVEVKYPPTEYLFPGTKVYMRSMSNDLILPGEVFKVIDVIGTRIALSPVNMKDISSSAPVTPFISKNDLRTKANWFPNDHGPQWGYATRDLSSLPYVNRNWTFGNGVPLAYITW